MIRKILIGQRHCLARRTALLFLVSGILFSLASGGPKSGYRAWRPAPPGNDPMNKRIEEQAHKLQSEQRILRIALFHIAYPRNKEEFDALDGNAVIYVAALAKSRSDFPISQVSVVANGKKILLKLLYSVLSDQTGSTDLSVKVFGPYRMDAIYLFPVQLRLKPADLFVYFSDGTANLKLTTFSANVPPQISNVVTDNTAGKGPSEQVLDRLIREELPGVLDGRPPGRSRPASEAELEEITARGRKLVQYDQAAWHATDSVLELKPDRASIRGYVAYEKNDRWRVAFGKLSEKRDSFLVAYEAVQREDPKVFTARKFAPQKREKGLILNCARALYISREDFGKRSRPYNIAVIPAASDQIFVYFTPAQTEAHRFPLGGDTRYLISRDGTTIIQKRDMHRAILEFKNSESGSPELSSHTAVLDDVPEDSDVFHVLTRVPPVPEMVLTPHFVYNIKTDGSIQYVTTLDAYLKANNKE
jgi:hypothetical protein